MKRTQASSLRQLSWCFALVLSLLISQFFGLQHRIDHTRWQTETGQLQKSEAKPARFAGAFIDAHHSCIALDAISLADCIGGALIEFIPNVTNATRVALLPWHVWDAAFIAHFRSRAPPALS